MENNKIDIIIKQGKLVKPVSSLSGGETKRLNLCIQLGIYDLIKSTCLVDFNFVVFDEIESQMDEQGIRSLIDIIDERRDYISTILWITNNPMVKESVEDKVLCKKAMGYTTIEYK
jgi:DNA repair exonuclease SbcCD ATPase subunit